MVVGSLGAIGGAAATSAGPHTGAPPSPHCVVPGKTCAIVLSHTSGYPRKLITLEGQNYYPADFFNVYWWTGAGPTRLLPSGPTAGLSGWFNTSFKLPVDPAGTYYIFVSDFTGDNQSVTFHLAPHISVSPNNGLVGNSSVIKGLGFSVKSTVTFTLHGVAVSTVRACKTSKLGTLDSGCDM